MKKVYVKPVVETIEVKVEKMIAQSVSYDNSIAYTIMDFCHIKAGPKWKFHFIPLRHSSVVDVLKYKQSLP